MNKEVIKQFFEAVSEYSDKSVHEFAFYVLKTFELNDIKTMQKQVAENSAQLAEERAKDHIKQSVKTVGGGDLVEKGKQLSELKDHIKQYHVAPKPDDLISKEVDIAKDDPLDLLDEMTQEFVLSKNEKVAEKIEEKKIEVQESNESALNMLNDLKEVFGENKFNKNKELKEMLNEAKKVFLGEEKPNGLFKRAE